MKRRGEVNIGGLAREQYGADKVALIGFSTYKGSVMASNQWAGQIKRFDVPAGRMASLEAAFHDAVHGMKISAPNKQVCIDFNSAKLDDTEWRLLNQSMIGHRAVGVVYNPAVDKYVQYPVAAHYTATTTYY